MPARLAERCGLSSKQVGVPFYLTDPKGSVRVFRPGDYARTTHDKRPFDHEPPSGGVVGTELTATFKVSSPTLTLVDR